MKAAKKIKTLEELEEIRRKAREEGLRLVFTNGCFDLLHIGHIRYLEASRLLGDILMVGVNSDDSVMMIKGPLRPITRERERLELVAALHCVDYVVPFETTDPLALIEALLPDVLVKGADWALGDIVGADAVSAAGGRVVRIPLVPGASSTAIIEKIVSRFGERMSDSSQGVSLVDR